MVPALILLLLSGCATHSWVPGPNARGTFDEARGNCTLVAKSGGSDFYAAGSARFVAGAAIAHGIGEAIRAQGSFNDCMQATGWVAADGQSQISLAIGNLSACASAAYNDPAFAELKPLVPSNVNGATSEQMANTNRATEREVQLLNERRSRILPCRQQALEQLRLASPVMASATMEIYAKTDESFSDLVDRRISWGEYIVRNRMAAQIGQTRIASNTLTPIPAQTADMVARANPSPAAPAKIEQATQTVAVRAKATNTAAILPQAEPPTEAAPVQSAPAIRAIGWEATVSRLGGAAR